MGIDLDLAGRPPRLLVRELTRLKFVRYAGASAVAVVCGQAALWTFTAGFGWKGIPANLGSVAIGSVPNYLINRYWTWQQSGRNRFWSEIVPFWTMAFLGVVLSTVAVAYADEQWGTPLAISIAQLSGFGVLWFGRFLVLDRLMWRVVHDLHPEIDGTEADDGDGTGSGTPATAGNGSTGDGTRPAAADGTPAGDGAPGDDDPTGDAGGRGPPAPGRRPPAGHASVG